MKFKLLLFILATIFVLSCETVGWKAVSSHVVADPHKRFNIQVPSGWMRRHDANSLILSRDGLGLQFIKAGAIRESDLQTSLRYVARDKTKTLTLKTLLTSELADVVVSMIKNTKATRNIKVVMNEPATIGKNISGFRLLVEYKTNNGLRIKREVYGYAQDSELVFIMYQAPALHFFAKDHTAFKSLVVSFRRI